MSTPQATSSEYRKQAAVAAAAASMVSSLWRRSGEDFDAGWAAVREQTLVAVEAARRVSVASALTYTESVLAETGQLAPAEFELSASGFLASGPDGAPVATLFDQTPIVAKTRVAGGMTATEAAVSAGSWLSTVTLSMMADTRRQVYATDIAVRPAVTGYVRQVNPPACSRCIILAGKWFRWNQGFQRHPRCDCMHIPAAEDAAGDLTTDPYAYFDSLDAAEQDRLFGRSNSRAIREGADIYRVVNVEQRGLGTARGARLYGTPTRMTPDDIFRVAGTRTNAVRLLEEHGYITGAQVRGGNIRGRFAERFAAPISRPIVAGSARDRVLAARTAGVRDPLDRATMTAAERRLYDSWYRVQYIQSTGRVSASIGASSTSATTIERVASAADVAFYRQALETELRALQQVAGTNAAQSRLRLAQALNLL